MPKTLNRILFIALLLTAVVTFFSQGNYKSVNDIHPSVLEEPIQEEISTKEPVTFALDEYSYELTPLFDYEINGLIVHKKNYSLSPIYERNKVSPMDLCMIWGSNAQSGVYKEKSLKFSQDYRWCKYRWRGNLTFNVNQAANNHLVTNDQGIVKKIKSLRAGDQVQIKGKLVNIKATSLSEEGSQPNYFTIRTSTKRTDSGAGACENIYVEELTVLKEGNPISKILFKISTYGLILLFLINLLTIFL